MRLHADGVDHAMGSPAAGLVQDVAGNVVHLSRVDDLDTVTAGHFQPLRDQVHAEDLLGPEDLRASCRELADRPEPVDGSDPARRDVGELHGLPGCREDVRQVEEPVVWRSLRHLNGSEMRLRYPEELGLAARDPAVEPGIAEQRGALALVAVLRGLALREQGMLAHTAVDAGDVERYDDAIAWRYVLAGLGPDVRHDAHRLVAEDVSRLEVGGQDLVQVQV